MDKMGDAQHDVKATASLLLGIAWLIMWIVWPFFGVPRFVIPLLGAPINIAGLILGIKGLKSTKRGIAIAGIVISSFGLIITIIQAVLLYVHYAFNQVKSATSRFT